MPPPFIFVVQDWKQGRQVTYSYRNVAVKFIPRQQSCAGTLNVRVPLYYNKHFAKLLNLAMRKPENKTNKHKDR